jgi:hypothetical protein
VKLIPDLRTVACAVALVLAGCGGGSDDGGPTLQPSSLCADGAAFDTYTSATVNVGQAAGATVAGCSGAIAAPRWTQTGGPAVSLLADKTQTIGFIAQEAGAYGFRVAFTDSAGAARTADVSIVANGVAAPTRVALRGNQSVRMGGNVSVRAWPALAAGDSVQSISWAQIEGPAVQLDTRDDHAALFVAPNVTRDTLIRLRATLRTASGATASDEAIVLVERYAQAPTTDDFAVWAGEHVSRVYAYRDGGPYAAVLARCVYDAQLRIGGPNDNACALGTLPFLGQETGGALPTVEQVMNRVVVSHDWLGRNFENFLRTQDINGDFRRMMNSVTAVVLGAQVRPSFYYAATGAIYLDGDNFWLTPDERDTVNEAPDFRSDFGRDLNYSSLWRYVQSNRSIFVFFDERQRINRDVSYLLNESGWLMYHELGHALDFLPPSQYASLSAVQTVWGAIGPRFQAGQLASDTITARYPLTSTAMAGLGEVNFRGATATAEQRAYTPQQVAGFFSADLATDDYAYSTSREDVAMSLEEFLMSHRLGIRRDVAITDKITDTTTGSTLFVRWGQRGRVGEAAIKPRVREMVQALTPWVDPAQVDALAAPIAMRAGDTWSGNLVLPAPQREAPAAVSPWATREQLYQFRKELQRQRHHRHEGTKALPAGRGGFSASR